MVFKHGANGLDADARLTPVSSLSVVSGHRPLAKIPDRFVLFDCLS